MPNKRVVWAYFCAVLCGFLLVDAVLVGVFIYSDWTSPIRDAEPFREVMGIFIMLMLQLPFGIVATAPIVALFVYAFKKTGKNGMASFILGGAITPVLGLLLLLGLGVLLGGPIDEADQILTISAAGGAVTIPAGALGGYVFWRLGFRSQTVEGI